MNSNRGQYNTSPLYNMKAREEQNKRRAEAEGVPVAKKRYAGLSVIMSLVLPALFLLSLLIPNNTLRWGFLAAAGVSVLVMWMLRAFVKSARSTLTVIYAALAVVIGLALFMNRPAPETAVAGVRGGALPASAFSDPDVGSVNALLQTLNTEEPTQAPDPEQGVSEAQKRLEAFFGAWFKNSVSEMLQYCVPSWVMRQTSPEGTLFQMLNRYRPVNYIIEDISGSDGNTTRIVTAKVEYSENGAPVIRRLHIVMQRLNDMWYVDPDSLDGVPVDEAAEAAARQVNQPHSTIAPTPTPAPAGSGITVYYNEKGGKYYHAQRTCTAVDSSYWPLTGFSFDLINSQQYKALIRCTKCNPPERPAVGQ